MTKNNSSSLLYFALRQSGGPGQVMYDFRPITLRHQVSLILLFAQPVDPDRFKILDSLALRRRLSTVLLFRQPGNHGHTMRSGFRSMALRRRISPVLLFSEHFYFRAYSDVFQSNTCSKLHHFHVMRTRLG